MSRPAAPIQSFKQVRNDAEASRAAATTHNFVLVSGVDNYTGPSTPANNEVPTGAVIKYIDIQIAVANLVSVASMLAIVVEHLRSGQSPINPDAVGGNANRNQVHLQLLKVLGKDQSNNYHIRFKVPRKFQRVREGDSWNLLLRCTTVFTSAQLTIYKFYR